MIIEVSLRTPAPLDLHLCNTLNSRTCTYHAPVHIYMHRCAHIHDIQYVNYLSQTNWEHTGILC